MLDFERLRTPPNDGDVLVEPSPSVMARWTRENNRSLSSNSTELLGRPLSAWRAETRDALADFDDRPVVVLGHQPEFIHAGVWSKHVVAHRLAQALEGVAINLVVDNDAPRSTALVVPSVESGAARLRSIRSVDVRAGYAYEQMGSMSPEEMTRFSAEIKAAMGTRFEQSLMPAFLSGVASTHPAEPSPCRGWVDQHLTGRRAMEETFGIKLVEYKVSDVAYTPVAADILLNAARFRSAYNEALAGYRKSQRIRGVLRPIPDLARREDAVEVPLWVYRRCEARRRLFVRGSAGVLTLFADRDEIGSIDTRALQDGDVLRERIEALGDWRLRPRALTLTLWARLLLADLFIHGIGGAKYDRITDAIMGDYYGVIPPRMGCASATKWLDLPRSAISETEVSTVEHKLRDVRFNPQRYLSSDDTVTELIKQRAEAIEQSKRLRQNHPTDRRARKTVFRRIRSLNAVLGNAQPDVLDAVRGRLDTARVAAERNRIAQGREYFFGLHERSALESLQDALPRTSDFAV